VKERTDVQLSNENLLVVIAVGVIAGWLAGKIAWGTGFGLIGDAAIGIVGALVGDWLAPQLLTQFGAGIVALTLNAAIGAIVLLLVVSVISGGLGWRGRGRWGGVTLGWRRHWLGRW
jgi:uncharacterized membrane protein YeaQ/YmgE (transglycosylase-associated protein family)